MTHFRQQLAAVDDKGRHVDPLPGRRRAFPLHGVRHGLEGKREAWVKMSGERLALKEESTRVTEAGDKAWSTSRE